jgi:hypothetical protein
MPILYSTKPLRLRDERDYYPTPYELALKSLETFRYTHPKKKMFILDPGAGDGVWGRAASVVYPDSYIYGVENDMSRAIPNPVEYSVWDTRDYLLLDLEPTFDLVIGNPPYKYAEEFVRKSYDLLEPNGHILFLLRLAFLEGQNRYKEMFDKELRPVHVWVLPRRPSFTENRKTDSTAYAIYVWNKYDQKYPLATLLDWLSWSYDEQSINN